MRYQPKFLITAALAMSLSAPAAAQQQMQHGRMMQQGEQGMMQGYEMRGPMMGGMDGHMMGQGYGHMMGSMMEGGPATHIEGRLAFLKTELAIKGGQEDAWNAYAGAMRSSANSMQQMHDVMMSGDWPTSFPERIERHEKMMFARLESIRTLRKAAVPLYEALDGQQKQVADRIMGMGMM